MFLLGAGALWAQEYSLDVLTTVLGGGTSRNGDITVSGLIQPLSPTARSSGEYRIVGEFLSVTFPQSEAGSELPGPVETLYASNGSDKTITKFTTNGVSSLFASTEPNSPLGLAFDRAGNLYVAVSGDKILRFTPERAQSTFADTLLSTPAGLAFDGAGNLYIANNGNHTIAKFTPGGVASVFAASGLNSPTGLAFDGAGNLYIANGNSRIMKFTPEGVGSLFAATGLYPTGLAFDSAGNLYAALAGGYSIQKFTPDGVSSVFASSGLNATWGLAFDRAGNLYAANSGANTIQKFKPDGTGSVFASTGLHSPTFITFTHLSSDVGAPPPGLRITAAENIGNELRLTLNSVAGRRYEIESLTDVPARTWEVFPGATISSAAGTVQITIPIAFDRLHQFYRVHVLP